jgi:hypothetical protein
MSRAIRSALTVLAATILSASVSSADPTPIVRGIADSPVWHPANNKRYGAPTSLTLDSLPPASVEFYFEVPIPSGNQATGTLEVWPIEEQAADSTKCNALPAGGTYRQHYVLAMTVVKDGDQTVLRATVPALQVNQAFCFAPKVRLALTTDDIQSVAVQASQTLLANFLPAPAQASTGGAAPTPPSGATAGAPSASAPGAAVPSVSCNDGPDAVRPLVRKAIEDSLSTLGIKTRDVGAAVDFALATYETSVVTKCVAAQAARDTFSADMQAVSALQATLKSGTAEQQKNAQKSLSDATKKEADDKKTDDADSSALLAALQAMFTSSSFASGVVVTDAYSANGMPGQGTTPAAANYASVDAGVLIAGPSGGTTSQPIIVPYLGLNVYFTPVDRTIPVSQLAGTWAMRNVWQRVSLTLGSSLATPSVPGRSLSAPFAGVYPIAGVGYRLTQFIRVSAGAIFYTMADINPASGAEHLSAAPFVAGSLDIDVIHLLTQAKL